MQKRRARTFCLVGSAKRRRIPAGVRLVPKGADSTVSAKIRSLHCTTKTPR